VDAIFNSGLLVFFGEMGDKTQLLSLILVARYKKPWLILLGVLIATLANHALAAVVGQHVASYFSPDTIRWTLGISFFVFAIWILFPDKEGEIKSNSHFGILLTTIISFFIAEMGDKTQLATIALAATYSSVLLVTVGSTLGMIASNAFAIFVGERALRRIPMQTVRVISSTLFVLFGLAIIFEIF